MRILTRSTLALALCLTACAKRPAPTPAEPVPPQAERAVEGTKIKRPPAPLRNLFFGFDVDTLTSAQRGRVTSDCLRSAAPRVLTGFASNERSGKYKEAASVAWNQSLSARRANSVRLAYTLAGCPLTNVQYFGETSKWGKSLPSNRRVTIQRK